LTLAEYRAEHGITQPEMALRLGVSAQSISRWERGVCEPRSAIIRRIQHLTKGAVAFKDWSNTEAA
jgi:transcriptional regulator with XRE-family HTH domain